MTELMFGIRTSSGLLSQINELVILQLDYKLYLYLCVTSESRISSSMLNEEISLFLESETIFN